MIVLKFGGTSVGDIVRLTEAATIIESQPEPRAAVVSAASGVTNLLLEAAEAARLQDRDRLFAAISAISQRHLDLMDVIPDRDQREAALAFVVNLHGSLVEALEEVFETGELSKRQSDSIVSCGEKSMSVIMAALLRSRSTPAIHLFADTVIATDDRFGGARPDRDLTRRNVEAVVRPLLEAGQTVVMTGFIGQAPDGSTTTLGRGGSDYSATLLGAALDADEVQIWTDVPGVLSSDPRKVPSARVVPEISFDEAQELAHFGAKVLHPRTIRPAVALDIPVRILSTFAPDEPGTLVTRDSSGDGLKAVTAMSNLLLVTIDVPELEDLSGAAAQVFGALHEERIEVVLASQASSRRRMTYLLDAGASGSCQELAGRLYDSLGEFEAEVGCTEDVAIVAAVGSGAAGHPRALSRLLTVLQEAGIKVLASSQQTSNVALVVAIPGNQATKAVEIIHEAFIGQQAASARGKRQRRSRLMSESLRVG